MRALWRGPQVELVLEEAASTTAQNAVPHAASAARARRDGGSRDLRAAALPARALDVPPRLRRARHRGPVSGRPCCADAGRTCVGARRARRRRTPDPRGRERDRARVTDTIVFIPAWNEEANLPAVLDGLHAELPEADLLVVDDGSTDRTADVAREHGAEVLSLGENRGLRVGIAAGYRWALEHELRVLRPRGRGRSAPGARAGPPAGARPRRTLRRRGRFALRVGRGLCRLPLPAEPRASAWDGLLRRAMKLVLRRPFGDATSGLYAVNAKALPLLAETFQSRAPGGRGADPDHRRGPEAGRGAGHDGGTCERRVEAARLEGGQARRHGDRDTRRGTVSPLAATLAARGAPRPLPGRSCGSTFGARRPRTRGPESAGCGCPTDRGTTSRFRTGGPPAARRTRRRGPGAPRTTPGSRRS